MRQTIFPIIRWVAAIGFLCGAYILGSRVTAHEDTNFLAVMPLLYSIGLLILGVLCMGPELMHWGSIPIRMVFENMYNPGERGVPPPDYNIIRLYIEQERYEEALEQYQQILHYHPDEFLAYVEGIQLAFELDEREVADKLYQKGLGHLTTPETVEHLKRVYAEAELRAQEAAQEEIAQEEGVLPEGEAADGYAGEVPPPAESDPERPA